MDDTNELMAEIDLNAAKEGRIIKPKPPVERLVDESPPPPEVVETLPAPPPPVVEPESPPPFFDEGKPRLGRLISRLDKPVTIWVDERGNKVQMRVSPRANLEIDGDIIIDALPNGVVFVPYNR